MLPAYAPLRESESDDIDVIVDREDDPTKTRTQPFGGRMRGVSKSNVLLTLNQLAVMSQNGVEIADALLSVAKHCKDPKMAESLQNIHEAVNSGNSLSVALAHHGKYFPTTLAPMIAAAEVTGDVPDALRKVCERLREQLDLRGSIIGALIYPIILVGASTVVMSALVLGVLPQFKTVFVSMGKEVPTYTQVLLDFGVFCREHWMIILAGFTATIVAIFFLRSHAIARRLVGNCLMFGPMISGAYRPLSTGRVFRTIAAMVKGGIPLLQAVRLTRGTVRDAFWMDLLNRVESNLIDGLPASAAFETVDFLPAEASQMMLTAEKTGRIGEVLEDVGCFYEQEGARKIKRLVVTMEPIIILLLGVLVAGIVLSVVLPMLDISTVG